MKAFRARRAPRQVTANRLLWKAARHVLRGRGGDTVFVEIPVGCGLPAVYGEATAVAWDPDNAGSLTISSRELP